MAEKGDYEVNQPATDVDRERADRKGGKAAVTKLDSGLGGGETEAPDQDYQVGDCGEERGRRVRGEERWRDRGREEGKRG